ncbi:hypothetical protein [Bradyrhizobium sp. SZCCHNS3051]|nr:hypothetical protein [Bradyrhizobium sp. SZCCHNS3051]
MSAPDGGVDDDGCGDRRRLAAICWQAIAWSPARDGAGTART